MNIKSNDGVPTEGVDARGNEVSNRKAGRKPEAESRKEELCQALVRWQEIPESSRPSLRALAKEKNTSHQLLQHYLVGLDDWRRDKKLEQFRANAAAKGVKVTPAMERRYLAWAAKIEARQARDAANRAAWDAAHPGLREEMARPDFVERLVARMKLNAARWS